MPFDPFLDSKLNLLEGLSREAMSLESSARFAEFSIDPAPWSVPAGVSVEDVEVPGPHGPVACRVYIPAHQSGTGLVWVHGGGFQFGDLDMHEAHVVSAELAARADVVVVSVGYRLATDGVRYPVPIDEVIAAWAGVADGGAHPATARLSTIVLGGASAGAALTLSTAMRLRDAGGTTPSALLLAYPFAHFPNPALDFGLSAEMARFPQILRCTSDDVEGMVTNYVGRLTDLPPDALPGTAPLDGLPPVHLVVSEYDDLRPSAELLQRQLTEVGVPVSTYLSPGMPHGHLNRTPSLPEVDRSLRYFATALIDAARSPG